MPCSREPSKSNSETNTCSTPTDSKSEEKGSTIAAGDTCDASVRRSEVDTQTSCLPKGIIGPLSTACVKVDGKPCTALLDSGSRVTIIFDSCYTKYLSHVPLHPVSGLNIWGLSESESSYPYRGYIQVELEIPERTPGKIKSVPVLALVCPDPRCSDNIPILVGTNVDQVRRFISNKHVVEPENILSARACVTELRAKPLPATKPPKAHPDGSPIADVQWSSPGTLVIPAGSEYVAVCKVNEKCVLEGGILITERASSPALPPSVLVQPTVLFSKMVDKKKFLVLLCNESLKTTSIPKGTVLAHLRVADMVMEVPSAKAETGPKIDPSLFDFGDSPIPNEWKDRLRQKLSERSNVFSTEEWDVGLAKGVEHRIQLNDETPFKERSHRVTPADLDNLRRHLQGPLG